MNSDAQEDIRRRAYFLWEAAGCPDQESIRFWFEAEFEFTSQPTATKQLETSIDADLNGWEPHPDLDKKNLLALCKAIDFWIAPDTLKPISEVGLDKLAKEIQNDYVVSCYLAWRREYKYAYISLRSFLESFCLLLYYLNQGFDRVLYLKGCGYKYMLHRMVQQKQPDDTHAFRRHYQLILEAGAGGKPYAKAFFDEVDDLYGIMSRAVHGDFSLKEGQTHAQGFQSVLCRSLKACNTLALYDSAFDATEDELNGVLKDVLTPATFQSKSNQSPEKRK